MIKLREHQQQSYDEIKQAMQHHQAILFVAPTGFGKTIMMAAMAWNVRQKSKKLYFTVHRRTLITQSAKTLDKFTIDYGIISAGYIAIKKLIQVCSIDSLKNRLAKHPIPDLLVIDEAHHCRAKGWGKVVTYYKEAGSFIIGLTATPDPELSKYFDVIVEGKNVKWLIENKFLSDYTLFVPSHPDTSSLHVRMGDYVQKETEALMDKPKITGDAITHWNKYAKDKRTIAFCVSIAHSKHTASSFNSAGIPSAHLDGDTSAEERSRIIYDFAMGKIKVITNCGIFCEGFDLSAQIDMDITVEAVILLRPTQSLTLYLQQVGRALRYKPYNAIILDHANCVETHGLPDEEREWSLTPGDNKKKAVPTGASIKICPKCFAAQLPFRKSCSFCKFVFETQDREVEHVEGVLVEANKDEMRRKRLKEQGACRTREQLIEFGRKNKYSWPEQWADRILKIRAEKNKNKSVV